MADGRTANELANEVKCSAKHCVAFSLVKGPTYIQIDRDLLISRLHTYAQSIGSPSLLTIEIETARLIQTKIVVRSEVASTIIAQKRAIRSIGRTKLIHFTLVQLTNAKEKRSVAGCLFISDIKLQETIVIAVVLRRL